MHPFVQKIKVERDELLFREARLRVLGRHRNLAAVGVRVGIGASGRRTKLPTTRRMYPRNAVLKVVQYHIDIGRREALTIDP